MKLPFDHFDLIARYYDRLIGRPEHDPLPELLQAEPGQVVLDVGGGTGRNVAGLAANGATVVICDRSLQMLQQARAKRLPAVLASVSHLPFATGSAPRVLIVDAFHHFVDPTPEIAQAQAVPELVRVLEPGGRLVVEEPDIRRFGVKLIALMERMLLMGSRFLTPQRLVARFESAGVRTIAVNDAGFSAQLVFTAEKHQRGRGDTHG